VAIDTRALGLAVLTLGGGRSIAGAAIDPAVGLSELAGIADEVGRGRALCRIHARGEADAKAASAAIQRAYTIGEKPPKICPPVIQRISAGLP
jgi:thymidine phosphorylase